MKPRTWVVAVCAVAVWLSAGGPVPTAMASDEAAELWPVSSTAQYGSQAASAWATATGAGSVIAVIDTGITPNLDLTGSATAIVGGNVAAGYDFVSDPSKSLDGDGWDADPTDTGEIFDSTGSLIGKSWHGTHVAGIAAALHNGTGVVGVAPGATVVPIRVRGTAWNTDTGSLDDAIRWGAGLAVSGTATNDNPADVINLSLDVDGACPAAVQDAIDDATSAGTAVVVAADNTWSGERQTTASRYPANCSNVIRVTASTQTGVLESFSNVGTAEFPATVAAPGTVMSTCPSDASITCTDGIGPAQGTSMSAPLVSGTIALLRQVNPALSVSELFDLVSSTATPFATDCASDQCGAGTVNAAAAVAKAAPEPLQTVASAPVVVSAPTSGVATASSEQRRFTKRASPKALGVKRVGALLRATKGMWSPKPSSYRYQWRRNGTVITGATKPTYRLTKTDRHKRISVTVTAKRPGYLSASASSRSYRVR
jgi:serine protease